ncbi:MAG: MaoC/PaaZ C-terminal domain-containing protein [Dehalococcoidia bacterium]
MANQKYFEDVEIGMELDPMIKKPTTRQLVKWAGAAQDWNEMHYDKDFAKKAGLPDVAVHGHLTSSFLAQLLVDWMGEDGFVKKLVVNWKRFHHPGQEIVCKGKVTDKRVEGNEHIVELDLWTETNGDVYAPHKAIAVLPSKG